MKSLKAVLMVVTLALAGCASDTMTPFNQQPFGWVPYTPDTKVWEVLIDGDKGLGNFNRVGDANWLAQRGVIQGDRMNSGKGTAHLVTKKSYKDFQIYAEFWADEEANSGIFIRATNPKDITSKNSYEVNIYDKRPGPEYGTGAIVNFAKVNPMPKAANRWNTFVITAKGTRLTVEMNGVVTADIDDKSFAQGPFTLQYGSGIIKWRKVMVREL
jgi:Domain of Unknown Function (DUF1080)